MDGWVARLVAHLLFTAKISGFESRHPSKIINRRNKQRSGQYTVACQKYTKNYIEIVGMKTECVTFSGKEKRGEMMTKMITLINIINDNTHAVQGKMITQK